MLDIKEARFVDGTEVCIGTVMRGDGEPIEVVGLVFSYDHAPADQHLLATVPTAWQIVGAILDGLAASNDQETSVKAMRVRLFLKEQKK